MSLVGISHVTVNGNKRPVVLLGQGDNALIAFEPADKIPPFAKPFPARMLGFEGKALFYMSINGCVVHRDPIPYTAPRKTDKAKRVLPVMPRHHATIVLFRSMARGE